MTQRILDRLHFSTRKKLPMILQTEVAECGLACLAMIASYYGHKTDLLSLRRGFSVSLKGSKLKDLIHTANALNLSSRAVKLELDALKYLKVPCILHWDLNHFVVLKKITGNMAVIHDPAIGVVKYKLEEVSKHFTGVAMELTPTLDFRSKKDKTNLSLSELFSSFIGLKPQLVQILLITLALEVFALVSPLFIQLITDEVIAVKDFSLLYTLAIGFGLIVVTQAVASYVRSNVIIFLSNTLNMQLVANLFHHLFKLPLSFFEKRHMGDVTSRFDSVTLIQEKLSTEFVVGIVDGCLIILTFTMMWIYSRPLTAVVLLALAIYSVIRTIFYTTMKQRTQESIIASAKEQSILMENIRAILPLKIFAKEAQREEVWQNCYIDKLNIDIRLAKLDALYRFLMELIFGLEHIVIVGLGANFVMNRQGFSIGMLMAYLSYRYQFVSKAQSFIDKIIQYQMVKIHLQRVADIVLTEAEANTGEDRTLTAIQGNIQVKDLAFRYSEHDPYVFKHISFAVKAGEVLVMIGSSGCGKTTLMKILLGLLTPSEGSIFVDNISLDKLGLHAYRSQIAAVMQEDVLLSGSIAENICFFDQNPDFDRIFNCAMAADIHNDIISMPMSYQSSVGDMGTTLSGGQKQRVLLARALYAQPKILFLDEANSNLDLETDHRINKNIKRLGITRIIISHRKETVSIADHVLDLEALIKNT
jgi:ATP-binding cassette subfamily B protein RaxB